MSTIGTVKTQGHGICILAGNVSEVIVTGALNPLHGAALILTNYNPATNYIGTFVNVIHLL